MDKSEIILKAFDELVAGVDSERFPSDSADNLTLFLYKSATEEDWIDSLPFKPDFEDDNGLSWFVRGDVTFIVAKDKRSLAPYGHTYNEVRKVYKGIPLIYYYGEKFICVFSPFFHNFMETKIHRSIAHTMITGQIKVLRSFGIKVNNISDYTVRCFYKSKDVIFTEPFTWELHSSSPLTDEEINSMVDSLELYIPSWFTGKPKYR